MSDDRLIPTPAPADRPSFKIKVGGTEISAQYQVQALIVERSFNRVASAELRVLDGDPAAQDFKVSNSDDFKPGNDIEILAGYHGNEQSIFKGIIIRHGLRVWQKRPSLLGVECRDKAVKLTVGRKSAYFYDVADSDVIEQISQAAGLKTDVSSTNVSHPQMVQFYSTDWDFIVTRAEANGLLVATIDGKLVVKAPNGSGTPVLSLAYGKNLLDFEALIDARDQFASVQSSSWDPANQQMVEIEGVDPSAVSPGNLSTSDLSSVIGLDPLKIKHAGQVKDSELQA
ncbi:MAG: phage late control D family protein, partial [Acidobacteria bacterium]